MWKNYLKSAVRNLWKNKFYSFINIFGLAVGMGSCLLILVHVRNELSYDRFQPDADKIYRIAMHAQVQDNETDYPLVGYPWAGIAKQEIPQIESSVRMFGGQSVYVNLGDQRFEEERFFYVDSNFTDIFHLDFIAGDPQTAMISPNKVVITEATAQKYFGVSDAVGKLLQVELGPNLLDVEVSGVVQQYPHHSHFHFDFLCTMSTAVQAFGGVSAPIFQSMAITAFYSYIKTESPEVVEGQLTGIYNTRVDEASKDFLKGVFLQPLTDIHLHSSLIAEIEPNGSILYVYVFLFIALLTLVIASINYMNLATARAANRSKEVGLRKVVGAYRSDLIRQFLGESLVVALIGIGLGIIFAEFMRLYLTHFAGIQLAFDYLADPFIWMVLIAVAVFVGLIAGSYPAFFLSGFKPIRVLRGSLKSGAKGGTFRRVLVIFQFCISTALIIGTGVLFSQLNYIQNMDMGFQKDWRVMIPLQIDNQNGRRVLMAERLKQAYRQHPGVVNVAATQVVPGQPRGISQVRVDGQPQSKQHMPVTMPVDFAYVETMGMEIIDGRDFDLKFRTDSTAAVLINEAAIREMEIEEPVIGTELIYVQGQGALQQAEEDRVRIVGVFKDMHFEPVYREIHPMILRINPNQCVYLVVHIRPEDKEATLNHLEDQWKAIVPGRPFQQFFLDDELRELYQAEAQLGSMVSFFTILAILIACLGLFGLSAYTTEQRRKEISIRKVLGASVGSIMVMLSKEFLILVLIAFPFAAFIAWKGTSLWLDSFAYQTTAGVGLYILAGVISLLIAFLTVSYLTYKAANSNPADSLHRE